MEYASSKARLKCANLPAVYRFKRYGRYPGVADLSGMGVRVGVAFWIM